MFHQAHQHNSTYVEGFRSKPKEVEVICESIRVDTQPIIARLGDL